MNRNPIERTTQPQLVPAIESGWPLLDEPATGRRGPVLARAKSTFMAEIDDGWVLPSEVSPVRSVPAVEPARINLNTASLADLQTIPGVGRGKASRIVSWRARNGNFGCVQDLAKVSGFGAKSVAKIADQLSV